MRFERVRFVQRGCVEFCGCDGIVDWRRNHHGYEDAEDEDGEEEDHGAVGLAESADGFGPVGDEVPLTVEIIDTHGVLLRAGETIISYCDVLRRGIGNLM